MKQFIIISLLSCWFGFTNAQKLEPTLEKVVAHYEAQRKYELTTTYSLYRGHTRARISEQYKSTTIKNNQLTYVKALNSEIVQKSDKRLVVDHEQKKMYYQTIPADKAKDDPMGLKRFVNYYKLIETKTEKGIQCLTLQLKNEQLPLEHSIIKLYINLENYALIKEELFSNRLTKFFNDDGTSQQEKSLLVIEFNEKKLKEKVPHFSDFILKKKGNDIQVTSQYSTYKIVENEKL